MGNIALALLDDLHVDTKAAASLSGLSRQTIWKHAKAADCTKIADHTRGGKSGKSLLIPLAELPAEAQGRYLLMREGLTEADLAAYRERYGQEGLDKLVGRLQAVMEMRALKGRKDAAARRAEIAAQMGVLPRCVYDWEHKYERDGLEGLMDKTMRADKGKSRSLCPLAQDRVNYLYMAPGKLSQNRVHKSLTELRDKLGAQVCEECCHNPESFNRQEMLARGGDPGEECRKAGRGLVVPDTRYALNRYVDGLDPAVVTLGRYGEKPFDDLYMPKVRRDKPTKTNAVWFGDHHIFDLFVDIGGGRAARPWLTAWMDACSGCIVGWAISLNPNSDTIIESLALGIMPTKGSPFKGMPEWLYIDNGKDYRCKRIEGDGATDYEPGQINISADGDNALLKTLGIGVTHAIPYRARSKTIERIFGLIEGQWMVDESQEKAADGGGGAELLLSREHAVLSRVVSETALADNRKIMENFQSLMVQDDLTEINATEIFERWCKWAADAVDSDKLEVDFDGGEPAYRPLECRMEVSYLEGYSWSSCEKAVIALICDDDEKLNVEIPLRHWKNDPGRKWDIDGIWSGDVKSLRRMSAFEVFLLKLSQKYRVVTLDVKEIDDAVTPSKTPEASFS